MPAQTLELYIKPGCPWCVDVVTWLQRERYEFIEHNVIADGSKFTEMMELTGQSSAPCMRVLSEDDDEDLLLVDFGVEELEVFVEKHEIFPA